jgi:hypothetical protein
MRCLEWSITMTVIIGDPERYNPMADLRERYPQWHVDFAETNGPKARIHPDTQQVVLDLRHLELDQDLTIAYIVALLDAAPSWPLSVTAQRQADAVARSRLGRPPLPSCCRLV